MTHKDRSQSFSVFAVSGWNNEYCIKNMQWGEEKMLKLKSVFIFLSIRR